MKTKQFVTILTAICLMLAALPACSTPTNPPTPTAPPTTSTGSTPAAIATDTLTAVTEAAAVDETPPTPVELGSVSYTVDPARKASGTFDFLAGEPLTLVTSDANGYGWMLYIPADALLTSQTITMTPFATIDVSQSGAKIISGVRFEPDGLQFVNAVRLMVQAPIENPGVSLIFTLEQDGSNVSFAPTSNSGKMASAEIWHFSAAGTDNGATAGDDGLGAYLKMAEEQYRWAMAAAKLFIKNGAPPAPEPPLISMFCRGTEVNPEEPIQADLFEFERNFFDPYSDIMTVLLAAMKDLQLLGSDLDVTAGMMAAQQIMRMAEKSILEVGREFSLERPPDHQYAAIVAALQVERQLQLLGASADILPIITGWAEVIRDYYLAQLKSEHDYRGFPYLMTLERSVQMLGGADRLADIFSAMTFEVILDSSFDATWMNGKKIFATGHVVQKADVKEIKNELNPPNFLWGTAENLLLKAEDGTFTDSTGTFPLKGIRDNATLWLLNWDACVTKSFDVMLTGFHGTDQTKSGRVAGAASLVSFEAYWWQGAGAYMFTVPMQNLTPKLGEGSFSGAGSTEAGEFTGSGQIHIVIKHTPK